MNDPSREYKTRLAARRQTIDRYRKLDRTIASLRLVAGILFFILLFEGFRWLLLLPVVVFVALIAYHEKILARARRTLRAIRFYEGGLARIEDRLLDEMPDLVAGPALDGAEHETSYERGDETRAADRICNSEAKASAGQWHDLEPGAADVPPQPAVADGAPDDHGEDE